MRGDLSFFSEVPDVYVPLATLGPKGPSVPLQLSAHAGGGGATTDWRLRTASGGVFWERTGVANGDLINIVLPAGWTVEAKATTPGATSNARATGKDYLWSEEGS